MGELIASRVVMSVSDAPERPPRDSGPNPRARHPRDVGLLERARGWRKIALPMVHPISIGRSFDLSGRTALVTGGSRGLGKAMARGLAEAGADILIASRHEAELVAAVADIGQGLQSRV
jgi:short chain dehydrogenase